MKIKLQQGLHRIDYNGQVYRPDTSGMIDVPQDVAHSLIAGGAHAQSPSGTTSARPTVNLEPGYFFFDTTLNKPIWRNAANSGWVDATGAAA